MIFILWWIQVKVARPVYSNLQMRWVNSNRIIINIIITMRLSIRRSINLIRIGYLWATASHNARLLEASPAAALCWQLECSSAGGRNADGRLGAHLHLWVAGAADRRRHCQIDLHLPHQVLPWSLRSWSLRHPHR